jgi:hypothetical protein
MPIYVHRNSQQLGPYTAAEVRSQLANGALSVHDHVWWQGQKGWMPLGESPVVASDFKEPAGPVRPAPSLPTGTSHFAIASLVCGCLSFFLFIFTSIPAIVFGHIALSEIKKNPNRTGRGLATAGLVIGYIITLLVVALFASYFMLSGEVDRVAQVDQARAAAAAPIVPNVPTNLPAPAPPRSALATNPAPASTNSNPITNSVNPITPATTNSPDQSTNSSTSSTNAAGSSTNAAPMSP